MKDFQKRSKLNLKNQKVKIQDQQRKMFMQLTNKKKNTTNNQKRNLFLKKIKMSLTTPISFCEP